MSTLETKISELERELALKKGYQAVTFTLPKTLPADVIEEIRTKLREVAENLATTGEAKTINSSAFTASEIETLKMLADTVLKKAVTTASPTQQPQEGQLQNASSVPSTVTLNGGVTTNPQIHVPRPSTAAPRKAKIITAENVRGEGKKYAAPDEEIYISSPDKVDQHGMVTATLMKRGVMVKIPLDDVELL